MVGDLIQKFISGCSEVSVGQPRRRSVPAHVVPKSPNRGFLPVGNCNRSEFQGELKRRGR